MPRADSSVAGRPLASLSLAINYALGGLDVRGYHLWNVAVHAGCASAIFGIVRRSLELPRIAGRFGRRSATLAFVIAVIWAVHPLNTEAVDYIIQRTESMAALFCLTSLYVSIRLLPAGSGIGWYAAAMLCSAMGMATKESAAIIPVIVALYDRIFVFENVKDGFRARWRLYLCLAAPWLLLAALVSSAPRAEVAGFSTGISPWTYLLNQTMIITHYLRLVFWPRDLIAFYGWPVALTLTDVLPYAVFIVALIALTIGALWRRPELGFLGVFFFITLAPSSSFIPVATEVGAERRMYLPLIAVIAAMVFAGNWLFEQIRSRTRKDSSGVDWIGRAVIAVIVVALMTGTILRNREYASGVTLARTVVERRPSAVAYHILGVQLMEAGQHDEAERELRKAVDGNSQARFDLGVELATVGKLDQAVEQLQAFVATSGLPYRLVPHWLEPSSGQVFSARLVMGRAYAARSQWPQAIDQFRGALAIAPNHLEAMKLLADAQFGQQLFTEAIVSYRKYLERNPSDADALNHLGIALAATDSLDEAIATFMRALELDRNNWQTERNLATALLDRRDAASAVQHAERAVTLNAGDAMSRDLYGRALAIQGRFDEAKKQFEAAVRIDPSFQEAREHLRVVTRD